MVAVFVVIAVAVGHDVESHLKAAGFTDSSSESERATKLLRESLGYDPNPAIVLVIRAPGGGPLDPTDPLVRARGRPAQQRDGKGRLHRPRHQPAAQNRKPAPS